MRKEKISKSKMLASFMILSLMSLGSVGVAQAATFTAADVAAHNTAGNCWVIINNNVYDLTTFVSTHSGGSAIIIAQCGHDGTAAFNSGPHSSTTINAIAPLMIGTLVAAPVLTSVVVTPASSTVVPAGTQLLVASPMDQNSAAFVGATVTFSSGNPSIATVNSSSGLVTAVAPGTATITATAVSGATSVSGTASVVVSASVNPVLSSVLVSPSTATISATGTQQLVAAPKDQNGATFVGATVTFMSSNPAVATVNASTGLVTAMSTGTATITATAVSGATSVTGSAVISVTASGAAGGQGNGHHGKKHHREHRGEDKKSEDRESSRRSEQASSHVEREHSNTQGAIASAQNTQNSGGGRGEKRESEHRGGRDD